MQFLSGRPAFIFLLSMQTEGKQRELLVEDGSQWRKVHGGSRVPNCIHGFIFRLRSKNDANVTLNAISPPLAGFIFSTRAT